jgi:hypothetical protein
VQPLLILLEFFDNRVRAASIPLIVLYRHIAVKEKEDPGQLIYIAENGGKIDISVIQGKHHDEK